MQYFDRWIDIPYASFLRVIKYIYVPRSLLHEQPVKAKERF